MCMPGFCSCSCAMALLMRWLTVAVDAVLCFWNDSTTPSLPFTLA